LAILDKINVLAVWEGQFLLIIKWVSAEIRVPVSAQLALSLEEAVCVRANGVGRHSYRLRVEV
jgi:hypothetical protein